MAQVAAEPSGNKGQAVFRLEFPARLLQHARQLAGALPEERAGQQGLAGGLTGEAGPNVPEVGVDDPLAEARGRGGAPVVRDLRRLA